MLNEDVNRSNIAAINEITQRCLILYNKLEDLLHDLEEIKNNHFDPFDKFDAEIADRTLGFYSTHVDADFIKQLEEEEIIYGNNYNAETFEKTVVDGIVGAGELLWGGIKTLGMLGAANWAAWTDNMDNVPAWADEQADKTVDGIDGMITFLDDPGRAGHNIAAGIEDSMAREYDENGIMAVTAVVVGMVVDPLAALGKAGKGAKFYKRRRNGETVLMTAREVNNLKRRMTVTRNMDEVLAKKRLAGAGKIDDIAGGNSVKLNSATKVQTNKGIEVKFKNPAGTTVKWTEQTPKDMDMIINKNLNSTKSISLKEKRQRLFKRLEGLKEQGVEIGNTNENASRGHRYFGI